MVQNSDGRSFVTWAETLHPETASVTIDSELQAHGSPWSAVISDVLSEVTVDDNRGIPVAVEVIALDEAEHSTLTPVTRRAQPEGQGRDNRLGSRDDSNGRDRCTDRNAARNTRHPKMQPWRNSNLVDLILGLTFTLVTMFVTFKLEFFAFVMYTLAALFHYPAENLFTPAPCMILRTLFLFLSALFMLVDSILLLVSVLVTELVAALGLVLCSVFGGPTVGAEWHQYIRRLSHLIRWAFRGCHRGWKPERVFPFHVDVFQPVPQDEQSLHADDRDNGRRAFDGTESYTDIPADRYGPATGSYNGDGSSSSNGDDIELSRTNVRTTQTRERSYETTLHESAQRRAEEQRTGVVTVSPDSVRVLQESYGENDDYVKGTMQVQID